MNEIRGILVINMKNHMFSNAAADDLVNILLLNGYKVAMKQVGTKLCIEYSSEISAEMSLTFPLLK